MVVGDAHKFLTPVLKQLSFQSHRLLFSHATAEVRGKNTMERKFASAEFRGKNTLERNFASTGYQTRNHQVMSLTRSLLNQPDGAPKSVENTMGQEKLLVMNNSPFLTSFQKISIEDT